MKNKLQFILYARKSTDEDTRQVTSLDAQRVELREFQNREHLFIIDAVEESRTAKEPGRPIFNAMLERIEAGEANAILCWDIDRLYRNPIDEGRVRWMLQRGEIACIRTPTRSYFPGDAGLLMAVEGGRATDFIIHHRRDVARGVREKLRRGEWPGPRAVGYIYDHDRRNIVPDPKRAQIVETVFQEVNAGRRGLMWVSDRLAQFGIRNQSGQQWSKSQVHKFLTNRIYTGVMVWNGEVYEGKYKPLIPIELFNSVQKVLKIRSKPRKVRKGHNFPFCGLFHCTCGSMMTAQWAKGHGGVYRYYRCTKKSGVCFERYLQEKSIVAQCLEKLKPLGITADEAASIHSNINERTKKDSGSLEADVKQISEKLSGVQEKLNRLTRAYLDEIIDEESYQAAKADLVTEKTALKQEKSRLQKTRSGYWIEPAREVVNALESAGKAQTEPAPEQIAQLVHKIGTNRLISQKTVSFDFTEPYEFTLSLLSEMRAAISKNPSLHSEQNLQSSKWCPRQDLNLYDVTH
jgi:site-specific DNA recombinase